jgi:hypothetical protein
MKKLLIGSLLSFATLTSFAAPKVNIYEDFMSSNKKEQFLKDYINNYVYIKEIIGKKKCDEVTNFGKIAENNIVMHLQVSCKNIKDDFHVSITKFPNTYPYLLPCKDAKKKYIPEVQCRGKLN